MKLTVISTLFTLLLISAALNAGLITGYVRIGSPEKFERMAVEDSQRALLTALVEDTNGGDQ